MQNRILVWIAIAAVCLVTLAIYFHSPKRAGDPMPASIASSENMPNTRRGSGDAVRQDRPREPLPISDPTLTHLRDLLAVDPSDENGHAADLLNNLCTERKFQTALQLVDAVPTDLRSDWLKIIFNRWAKTQPEEAMKTLDTIRDPDERAGAFTAAVDGWNSTDPAGLANFAINLSAPNDRDYAVGAALDNWSLQDPVALATWLNTLPRGDEFDYGAALMISKTDGANRAPELAIKWVENIGDPALKQNSFARVLAEWLQTDSAAAKQYVTTATWLDDVFRSKILSAISTELPD
jgi:hypothetical protein